MSKLINIPIGAIGEVNGQFYKAEADLFGCVACDLSDNGNGCINRQIVCWAPRRTFKHVEPKPDSMQEITDDYYNRKFEKRGCLPAISILLIGCFIVWALIIKLIIFIIHLF